MNITFTMPMALPSTSNLREHWSVRAKRAKAQRQEAFIAALAPTIRLPAIVTITRIAPRQLDSHDNLRASAKSVVDGVADALGLANDRDPRIRFEYAQERGKPAAVRVQIRSEEGK